MKLGSLESILLCVIVAGITWFGAGMHYKGQAGTGAAISLSPDVKSYIDTNLATVGGATNQCAEIPKLMARIADLQVKLGAIEVYRVNKLQKDSKQAQFLNDSEAIHSRTAANLAGARSNEITRIKEELGKLCAAESVGPPGAAAKRPGRVRPNAGEDDKTGSDGDGQ